MIVTPCMVVLVIVIEAMNPAIKNRSVNTSLKCVKGKVHPCTDPEALYRPYGP